MDPTERRPSGGDEFLGPCEADGIDLLHDRMAGHFPKPQLRHARRKPHRLHDVGGRDPLACVHPDIFDRFDGATVTAFEHH